MLALLETQVDTIRAKYWAYRRQKLAAARTAAPAAAPA